MGEPTWWLEDSRHYLMNFGNKVRRIQAHMHELEPTARIVILLRLTFLGVITEQGVGRALAYLSASFKHRTRPRINNAIIILLAHGI